ncbi:MAG: hypothetical protein ACFB50_01310 [Rubrobacteraceae bacterium]
MNRSRADRKLGLSAPAIVLLAALAAIRVPLHDLGLVREGSAVTWLLVFVPLAIWVAVVLWQRVANPILTLTVVGVVYGVMLAIIHQVFWGAVFGSNLPALSGNLEGVLKPGLESVFFRISAFLSSIFTGTLLGTIVGVVAWAIERVWRA